MKATARARANIALAKYWGKSDDALNLPAVPSISITLDPLVTETTVVFDDALDSDRFELDGEPAKDAELARVVRLLDEVRARAGITAHASVASLNHFPTAAGLASSASGFAALAAAASAAAGLASSPEELSARARRASASAARSIFGGFVELPVGEPGHDELSARQIAGPDHWDVRVIVAVTAEGRKAVGSRDAMGESRASSPYYATWIHASRGLAARISHALLTRDMAALTPWMEQSFLAMHAVSMCASPSILYWQPGSVAALRTIRSLRDQGVVVGATMDAGPHVKALCLGSDCARVQAALDDTPGVIRTLVTRPGAGVEIDTDAP